MLFIMERFKPVVHDKEDLTNVHVSCTCGEWDFYGDWDEMCDSWFKHEGDPRWKYLYITRNDHDPHTFLTRAAEVRVEEIFAARTKQAVEIDEG